MTFCWTKTAGAQVALPAWVARMMQVPCVSSEAVAPATVQTEGVWEVKVTGRPELAVADSVSCVPA